MASLVCDVQRRRVYSTGQVAKICCVAPRTVSKWLDTGRLKGYRIPGSNDRRVPHENLVRFMEEYGMPIPAVLSDRIEVIIATANTPFVTRLKEHLSPDWTLHVVAGPFSVGKLLSTNNIAAVVVDASLGRGVAVDLVDDVAQLDVPVLAVCNEDETEPQDFGEPDRVFTRPFDIQALTARLTALVPVRTR